jgi:hypothetical protein
VLGQTCYFGTIASVQAGSYKDLTTTARDITKYLQKAASELNPGLGSRVLKATLSYNEIGGFGRWPVNPGLKKMMIDRPANLR